MSSEYQNTHQEPTPEQADPNTQVNQEPALNNDSIELGLRFLVGLLAIGADEAARRLQEMQGKLNENPTLWNTEAPAEDNSLRHQVWHRLPKKETGDIRYLRPTGYPDDYWKAVSLTENIEFLNSPLQLHHAEDDLVVNIGYSFDLTAVVIAFFKFMFYWCVILSPSALARWGWTTMQERID